MKIPRHEDWHEGVGRDDGSIMMDSYPLHVWYLDKWLGLADEFVHLIERRLPVDGRGWSIIDRIGGDYWGNPICAAYLIKWHRFKERNRTQEVWVDVPIEKLSAKTRKFKEQLDEEVS